MKKNRFNIENVRINITNIEDAANRIIKKAEKNEPAYVCVTNVRATYIGNHDEKYCDILNNSFLTIPDGKPLVWFAHLSGFKEVEKTSGPDLFIEICKLTEHTELTHFFYGSTPEVIEQLQKKLLLKYPELKIVGVVSPPFKPVEELAQSNIINEINQLNPNFIWIGLGAPKQERFINLIYNKVNSSVLIGVGLVFEYEAGTVKRAPIWMQNYGLEWLFRFMQQPRYSMRSLKAFRYFILLLIKTVIFKKW